MTNTEDESSGALINRWITQAVRPRLADGTATPYQLRYSFTTFKEKNSKIGCDILGAFYLAWKTEPLTKEIFEILEEVLPIVMTLYTYSMDTDYGESLSLFKLLVDERRKAYLAKLAKTEATSSELRISL